MKLHKYEELDHNSLSQFKLTVSTHFHHYHNLSSLSQHIFITVTSHQHLSLAPLQSTSSQKLVSILFILSKSILSGIISAIQHITIQEHTVPERISAIHNLHNVSVPEHSVLAIHILHKSILSTNILHSCHHFLFCP